MTARDIWKKVESVNQQERSSEEDSEDTIDSSYEQTQIDSTNNEDYNERYRSLIESRKNLVNGLEVNDEEFCRKKQNTKRSGNENEENQTVRETKRSSLRKRIQDLMKKR